MDTREQLCSVTVSVSRGEPRTLAYASYAEAAEQADRWVAEALRFTQGRGDLAYSITHGPRTWMVFGYTSSSSSVRLIHRTRGARELTGEELRDLYRRRWSD